MMATKAINIAITFADAQSIGRSMGSCVDDVGVCFLHLDLHFAFCF